MHVNLINKRQWWWLPGPGCSSSSWTGLSSYELCTVVASWSKQTDGPLPSSGTCAWNDNGTSLVLVSVTVLAEVNPMHKVKSGSRRFAQCFIMIDSSLRLSSMALVNEGSHSLTCHRHIYPQVEWATYFSVTHTHMHSITTLVFIPGFVYCAKMIMY